MSKSLGLFLLGVTDSLNRLGPDILLLAGDRGEQLMAAIAGAHLNIPVAHIQAGELSGNIDGMTRHAITRYAHMHFASSEEAAERLQKMGEQGFRIHLTGAPQLDELVQGEFTSPEEVARLYNLDLSRPIILFVQHPVTEESGESMEQVKETWEAVCSFAHQTVAIFPNNDAGNSQIRRFLERERRPFVRIERNVPRHLYAGLMNIAHVLVGNSSSGLIEAPCFKLPAVNVGDRQRDRSRGINVIDVPYDREQIRQALEQALSASFRQTLQKECPNPYLGDGRAAQRIIQVLKTVEINQKLLKKQIVY